MHSIVLLVIICENEHFPIWQVVVINQIEIIYYNFLDKNPFYDIKQSQQNKTKVSNNNLGNKSIISNKYGNFPYSVQINIWWFLKSSITVLLFIITEPINILYYKLRTYVTCFAAKLKKKKMKTKTKTNGVRRKNGSIKGQWKTNTNCNKQIVKIPFSSFHLNINRHYVQSGGLFQIENWYLITRF